MQTEVMNKAKDALREAIEVAERNVYYDDWNVKQVVCSECGAMADNRHGIVHTDQCAISNLRDTIEYIEHYQEFGEHIAGMEAARE